MYVKGIHAHLYSYVDKHVHGNVCDLVLACVYGITHYELRTSAVSSFSHACAYSLWANSNSMVFHNRSLEGVTGKLSMLGARRGVYGSKITKPRTAFVAFSAKRRQKVGLRYRETSSEHSVRRHGAVGSVSGFGARLKRASDSRNRLSSECVCSQG
jgi:hypothetical protein